MLIPIVIFLKHIRIISGRKTYDIFIGSAEKTMGEYRYNEHIYYE